MAATERQKRTRTAVWEAWILYDPRSMLRMGIYVSQDEANVHHPGWRDEGYVLKLCEIRVASSEWDAGYDQAVREVLSEVAFHDKELSERIQYRFPEWAKVMRRAKRS